MLRRLVEVNIYYSIPVDKEKIMFDFYVAAFLSTLKVEDVGGASGSEISGPQGMRRPVDISTKQSFDEAKTTILQFLKAEFLKSIMFSVCAELRHVFDSNNKSDFKSKLDPDEYAWIKTYYGHYRAAEHDKMDLIRLKGKRHFGREKRGYASSYHAAMLASGEMGWDKPTTIEFAEKCFKTLSWSSSYGGRAWANICDGWLRLYEAESERDLFVWIDHIYDLQHNTDTVFNKLIDYAKHQEWSWIKKALTLKANVKDPYDLLGKCSSQMRRMAFIYLKASGRNNPGVAISKDQKKSPPIGPISAQTIKGSIGEPKDAAGNSNAKWSLGIRLFIDQDQSVEGKEKTKTALAFFNKYFKDWGPAEDQFGSSVTLARQFNGADAIKHFLTGFKYRVAHTDNENKTMVVSMNTKNFTVPGSKLEPAKGDDDPAPDPGLI